MERRTWSASLRKVATTVSVAALAASTIAGGALAGQLASTTVKSYTGCLSQGGTLTLIKEGDAPQKACPSGSTEAHFSGGDITGITVGTGLTGGGTNGDVTIALDPSYGLRQDCAINEVVKWSGTAWICADDNNTTYSNGTGLDLSSGVFSIDPTYRVKNTPDCSTGEFATGFDSTGTIQCAAPPATSTAVRIVFQPTHDFAGTTYEEISHIDLPEGTFALTARVELRGSWTTVNGSGTMWVGCELRDGATSIGGSESNQDTDLAHPMQSITVVSVTTAPAAGKRISLWCFNDGTDHGRLGDHGADIMALKVAATF